MSIYHKYHLDARETVCAFMLLLMLAVDEDLLKTVFTCVPLNVISLS